MLSASTKVVLIFWMMAVLLYHGCPEGQVPARAMDPKETMPVRARSVWKAVAVAGTMSVASGAIADVPPRWEETNAAALRQRVAVAVCLPREEEIVCIGIGCRKTGGYDFVEMITGDWLEGPTRLSAGGHITTTVMSIDRLASRAMNVPVSRGPISRLFLRRLIGNENERLRVDSLHSGYEVDFPLAGFRRAYRMLRHICAAERGGFRVS
jgi:hypothetical protein